MPEYVCDLRGIIFHFKTDEENYIGFSVLKINQFADWFTRKIKCVQLLTELRKTTKPNIFSFFLEFVLKCFCCLAMRNIL